MGSAVGLEEGCVGSSVGLFVGYIKTNVGESVCKKEGNCEGMLKELLEGTMLGVLDDCGGELELVLENGMSEGKMLLPGDG